MCVKSTSMISSRLKFYCVQNKCKLCLSGANIKYVSYASCDVVDIQGKFSL